MKSFKLIFLFLVLLPNLSFAGTEGHGGGGILCTDQKTGVSTVEILDFWNGEIHGLTIPRDNTLSVKVQIKKAQDKYSRRGMEVFNEFVKRGMKRAEFVDTDDFPVPTDTGEVILKPGCKLVGIVDYNDGGFFSRMWFPRPRVRVNSRIYSLLSNTDKAGLWFHEGAYSLYRFYETKYGVDSVFAQQLTAILFSTEGLDTNKWSVPRASRPRR